ncbi:GNAT family N-acetyltransferase [Sphingomonas sp. RHCKR47]|uniref:GNAT family N-acetyltransferase n=1 Tax=Sphingomonas citricola TaxID=2862498 RepID=UPI001C67ADB9|nr:GNAT family protein [Sphingomonas citricola]MBW6523775.1 GNAT family N-acetyltransferase [Sphingomonas citricola]
MSAWREAVTLSGRHVTLRPLSRRDRDAIVTALADVGPSFATIVPDATTIDRWYDAIEEQVAAGRALPFAVLDANGAVAGVTRFLRMNEAHRRVEIGGTVYAPRVQRTGVNTEAKRMLLTHAFDILGCQCVQLRTNVLNRASRTAIERLGARLDGTLRGHMVTPEGEVRDSAVYSIMAHEWPQVRRNLDQLMRGEAR